MARVFIDGWESGGYDAWVYHEAWYSDFGSQFSVPAEPLNGNTGTYSLKGITYTSPVRVGRDLLSDMTTVRLAFRFKSTYTDGFQNFACPLAPVIAFAHGTTVLCSLHYVQTGNDADYGKWKIVLGGNSYGFDGTVLATSANVVYASTIREIKIQFSPANSGGVFKVWIDGSLEIDYSGDTTGDAEHCDRIYLPVYGYFYGGQQFNWWDDLIIDGATLPDNNKIFGIIPTGAGNSTQLTPSAGSNYACVDDVPADDADYVSTNNTNDLDLYACGDLPAACTNVVSVQVEARVEKTDTPTPTTIGLALRTNSTDYASAGKAVTAAWTRIMNLWETNPNTSAAWTEAQVNALEIGVKALA